MALDEKLTDIMGISASEFPEKIKENEYRSRFKDNKDVDRVFCEYRLIWRNLMKYYLEEILDDDLDNFDELTNLLNNFGEKRHGGIKWINYAFSEKYKDEHNPKFARAKDFDMRDKKFTNMSLYEVLELWGITDGGKFIIPPEFAEYVRKSWEKGEFSERNIPNDPKRFMLAKEVFDELVENLEFPEQSAYAIMGAMWCECGWAFNRLGIVNHLEKRGEGVNGTAGWAGAGECWFGLTFWRQKLQLIKAINAPVPRTESEYNSESATHLCQLDWSWQVKILHGYIKYLQKKWGKIMCDPDGDPGEQIVASYAFKAGHITKPTLEQADATTRKYMRTHAKQSKSGTSHNTFAMHIFAAAKFSLFCQNLENGMSEKDAVPSTQETLEIF